MYSIENPAFAKPLGTFENAVYGNRFTGVGAQILGADDKYICQYSQESNNFWGSKFLHPLFVTLFSSCALVCYCLQVGRCVSCKLATIKTLLHINLLPPMCQ